MSDLEEALEKAGSKLTKAGKTTANDLSKKLGKALQQIKTLLTGKSKLQDDAVKGQLMEVAQVVKTAKHETKKLLALGGCLLHLLLLLLQSQVILEKVPQLDGGPWKMPLVTKSTQLVLEKAPLRGQTTWATQ